MSKLKYIIIVLLLTLIAYSEADATHLRAGEIIVERVNCQSLTFRITIIVYTDTESGVQFGEGVLRFGDNSDPDGDGDIGFTLPQIESQNRPDLGDNVAIASFTIEHTYSAPGKYEISYFENNRNGGILNMDNSIETPFFINAEIIIDGFLGCNNSPVLQIPPIDLACPGVAFLHNPGAFDPDGDSLSFELIVPKREIGTPVNNYRYPITREFYDDLPFTNEDGTGEPTIEIDPVTGLITWDAPGDLGNPMGREYNITFRVNEWRKIGNEWFNLGFIIRDMQIIVQDCENDRPGLIVPKDTCVVAGTILDEIILGTDPNFDQVKIEAFSQVFDMNSNSATYTPDNGVLQSTLPPNDTANVHFTWQTDCSHVRDQPYQVVFKITDDPDNGPKLVSFETWNITVIGPEPEWDNATIDFPNRGIDLSWDPYPCSNAIELQVWRRVDSFSYTPGYCETGMPEFLGFELIATLPPSDNSYFDDNNGLGLDFGASYCYRLVASFGLPGGGESILSQEVCLPPVEASAPVITNVSVNETDPLDGEITVQWTPPFDINTADFGTDYRYDVQRGVGLLPNDYVTVATDLADTFFVDTGLNTEQQAYAYRIVLYSQNGTLVGPNDPIETSSNASSVRLEPRSLFQQIELFWTAETPWSNNSQDYPWHYIYRKREAESNDAFLLIDSVNVNTRGYYYLDSGQFNNVPLVDTQVYCYYVTTKGTYGNPDIIEPLINDSQIACAQPSDDIPPCTPEITVETVSCEDFLSTAGCEFTDYRNELSWTSALGGQCQDDILRYDIYFSPSQGGEFSFLASTTDTLYVDEDLTSFARCYKVRAVDRSGNVSEFSEEVCFDNCPYFELPNVFTPNGDDCNDVFSVYSDRSFTDENGNTLCGSVDVSRCARFVREVNFKVVNRWGKLVYEYQSGGENSIYIDWDGRDLQGQLLASGTYYYIAEVTFDMVDPSKRVQTFKGWVQLIR